MEIKTILVPVDGSEHSMRAARYAADLGGLLSSELLLIHCHKPFPMLLGEPYFQEAHNRIIKKATDLMAPYRDLFAAKKSAFEERILEGPPGRNHLPGRRYPQCRSGGHGLPWGARISRGFCWAASPIGCFIPRRVRCWSSAEALPGNRNRHFGDHRRGASSKETGLTGS